MYKVIVWGNRKEYDYYHKWLEVEILKNNMQIEAIVLNEQGLFHSIDGIGVIGVESLPYMEYDYLIDMNQNAREQILRVMELLKIPSDKVIPVSIFGQPFFDLVRWVQVKESKVSIICNHCWGGYVYNTLGLKFRSPFINMFFSNEDFFKLLENIDKYVQYPLEFVGEAYEENLKRNYPIMKLDDVTIHFNHYKDEKEAIEVWNRRKNRINFNNLLIEMTAKNQEDIERFIKLPYENKVCFTMLPCDAEGVVSIQNEYIRRAYDNEEWQFALWTAMKSFAECKQYDLLKLLNHEKDYERAKMV